MSTTQEYYIRKATETDARGPFTLEQLTSLAETGQLDADTYYYDAGAESWVAISSTPSLLETLFPAKRSLRVKPKTDSQVKTLNTVSGGDRPITVNDMLLAADGRTADTKDSADPAIAQSRAAAIGLYGGTIAVFISAAAYILPHIDILLALDFPALARAPLAFLGLFHLALGVCLALGATGAYPAVRFAAMLGLGFTGSIFYLQDQTLQLAASAAAGLGLLLCTLLVSVPGAILAAILAVGGAGGVAYHLLTS
jgi:hypothetical protein